MAKKPKRVELKIVPGFNPSPDSTALDSIQFIDGDKVRFYNGKPQTVGGCEALKNSDNDYIYAPECTRFLIHHRVADNSIYSIAGGTNGLYSILGSTVTNITPLVTATTTIANSLATNYATLGSNPIATTNGSRTVVVTWASHKLVIGDYISISGAATTNGIPNTELNVTQYIQDVTTNTFTFTVATTAATSTGSGGGAAVVAASDLITVTQVTHGFAEGNRILIAGAADIGGILAASINAEHIIRVNDANTYTFSCSQDFASSSVSSGGGASTTVRGQIADGQCDATYGYGYGMGLYGVGRYGVGKSGYYPSMPRIWSGDFFGDYLILCPGTTSTTLGASIYQWTGTTTIAPTVVTNAPTDCNYVFVDNNIVVALCDNVVKWSNQGDQTDWTASATNQAGSQEIYGAGRLISRAFINGENLLFSDTNVYRMRYIGKPFVWEFEKLDVADGISGVHAAVSYDGAVFWKGKKDFYMYSGGAIRPLAPTSLRQYIFQQENASQCIKTHAWLNVKYGEIWWFYQSGNSNPDSYVTYSISEKCWFYGSWDRTASERNYILPYPRLISDAGLIIDHEKGNSALDGDGMIPYITTNYGQIAEGDDTMEILGVMLDTTQTGNIFLQIFTKLSPMSTREREYMGGTGYGYTINSSSSDAISKTDFRAHGRMRKYKFISNQTDQNASTFWRLGKIYEYLQLADGR